MLDELGLTTSALRYKELLDSPEIGDYSASQLLREILTPQFIETMDKRYTTNLRFSKLINKTDSEVNFVSIKVPFTEFSKQFEALKTDGKISEYIDLSNSEETE